MNKENVPTKNGAAGFPLETVVMPSYQFTKDDIEGFFLETIKGFYLNECAKNDPGEAKGFYDNQFGEFMAGFKCCISKMAQDHNARCLLYVDPVKSCKALKDRKKELEA